MIKHKVKCPYCGNEYVVEGVTPRYCVDCANTLRADDVDSIGQTVGWLWAKDCTVPKGTPNINEVDAETINRLTGIGISNARRIVVMRDRLGSIFLHPLDLLVVRNIGIKTAAKTLGKIAFKAPAPLTKTQQRATDGLRDKRIGGYQHDE